MKLWLAEIRCSFQGLQEIRLLRPWLLTILLVRGGFEAMAPFIGIYSSALIINGIAEGASIQRLLTYAGVAMVLNLLVTLLVKGLTRTTEYMNAEMEHKYGMRLNQTIIDMDYSRVENPETHHLREKIEELRNMNGGGIWRLLWSTQTLIRSLFTITFSVSLTVSLFAGSGRSDLQGIFGFVASPLFSSLLGGCVLANVLVGMYANAASTHKMQQILSEIVPMNRFFSYYLNQYLSANKSGKDIRLYRQQDLIRSEWKALFSDASVIINKMSRNERKYSSLATLCAIAITTLIYLFVGLKALAGLIGVGSILLYIGSMNEFTGAFSTFMNQLAMLRANNQSLKVYFEFLALPSRMHQGTLPVEKRALCRDGDYDYEIEFRHVSFRYPASEQYAIRDLSFRLRIGERLAVVGMNGSGKTTFIKLLCRLYDPTEGEILLNGIDIRKYNYEEYLSIFSVVFQDFNLFSFGLGQNVAAHVDFDPTRVEACLEEVGFGERYRTLALGTETCLYKDFEEQGVEISGGEAQKIAMARAVYREAPFIVLDEPTAALDPIAEFEIYSRFNELVGSKTAIYISHRLSSCRFCDNIAVFHEGMLVQRGSHEELVAQTGGKYYELWHAQARYYVEAAV